jgi:hypothetical protein
MPIFYCSTGSGVVYNPLVGNTGHPLDPKTLREAWAWCGQSKTGSGNLIGISI